MQQVQRTARARAAAAGNAGGHCGTLSNGGLSTRSPLIAWLPRVIGAASLSVIAAGGTGDERASASSVGAEEHRDRNRIAREANLAKGRRRRGRH